MLKNMNISIKHEYNLITLIGMMGTGKTKFGNLVANKLDYNFYDSDAIIEKKFSLTIRDIFTIHGENFFREVEKEHIRNTMNNLKKRMRKR